MFVRVKKIKGYQYAYLVENRWKYGTSKQKVKEYLGKVYTFPLEEKPFTGKLEGSFKEDVLKLITWQLSCYGFTMAKLAAIKDGLIVSFQTLKFIQEKSGKPFVLKGKEGYLCRHTFQRLLHFQPEGYEEQVGKELAKAFVDAGINIPKGIFIKLFQKIYNEPEE